MDEEVTIINEKTRNEKIKNFLIDNKKKIIFVVSCIVIIILGIYSFQIYKESDRENLSEKYNSIILDHNNLEKNKTFQLLKEIIKDKDSTYSPLALYFLIDNNLIESQKEANELFDILINKTSLEEEIKNLVIYKKALYNADLIGEKELLDILSPLINSKSIWKSHALYLLAEFFYSKDEKQKSKEFFNQILVTENANIDVIKESQKRLNRDLSD
tara:strand:- start:1096 stop:1740 length:645 start_codon:yes stop_codon:yes gene_type:complete